LIACAETSKGRPTHHLLKDSSKPNWIGGKEGHWHGEGQGQRHWHWHRDGVNTADSSEGCGFDVHGFLCGGWAVDSDECADRDARKGEENEEHIVGSHGCCFNNLYKILGGAWISSQQLTQKFSDVLYQYLRILIGEWVFPIFYIFGSDMRDSVTNKINHQQHLMKIIKNG
jgi:hypothetical protein